MSSLPTPKEAFLIKYGPDRHRDRLIDKARKEGTRPPTSMLSSPLLNHSKQDEIVKEFGSKMTGPILRNHSDPSPFVIDHHIETSAEIHDALSRIDVKLSNNQMKRALDLEMPRQYDTEKYMKSGNMTPDVVDHLVKKYPETTEHIVAAASRIGKTQDFLDPIIKHASSDWVIKSALRSSFDEPLPTHIVDKLVDSNNPQAHVAATKYYPMELKPHHIDKLIHTIGQNRDNYAGHMPDAMRTHLTCLLARHKRGE